MNGNSEPAHCPCCPNRCPRESLRCSRGARFFERSEKTPRPKKEDVQITDDMSLDDKVCALMTFCGELVSHVAGKINPSQLLSVYSQEEKEELCRLLMRLKDKNDSVCAKKKKLQ